MTAPPGHPDAAVAAWRAALGDGAVTTQSQDLAPYAVSTAGRGTAPIAAIYPQTTAHVVQILSIAREHGTPIYPISAGRNWGYGDANPAAPGCAIVDFRRMNRILEVNETLGYAVVEPGVTQQQLFDRLQGTALWMDSTGAGPNASIVGNALERGFGHTRYGDHTQTVCGIEAVLADGTLLRTGLGHYEGARAANVYPYGLGPSLDGLFFQSNLAIVTGMGISLMARPEAFEFFYLTVAEEDGLERIIDTLRPLRRNGLLNTAIHIANDLRLFSGKGNYPWNEATNVTPLPNALRQKMRKNLGAGAWNLSGSLTGTKGTVKEARRELKRALAPIGRPHFIGDGKLSFFQRVAPYLPGRFGSKTADQLRVLTPNYGLLKGIPARETLDGAQWRTRREAPSGSEPQDTDAGLLWISPVMPMTGADARGMCAIAEPIFHAHGFDPLMTVTLISERAMIGILHISFDRTLPEEVEAAHRCYDALASALFAAGYIPYRSAPHAIARYRGEGDPFWGTLSRIRQTFDPQGIIAPGRYVP